MSGINKLYLIEMTQRKISYKSNDLSELITYIDIGSCEKHYDFLPLYDESKTSYTNWYRDFQLYSIGEQILTLHYYLLQYNSGSYMPDELNKRISKNIDLLNKFKKDQKILKFSFQYSITNYRFKINVFEILSKKFNDIPDTEWIKKSEISKIPIPTLFKKILN